MYNIQLKPGRVSTTHLRLARTKYLATTIEITM